MPANLQERKQFSERLQKSLKSADYSEGSPTKLSREFNARFPGSAVTVHAARRWLIGEAIPAQAKLKCLASWLGVPAEWLRYGGDEPSQEPAERFDSENVRLMSDIQRLDDHHKKIARDFISALVRANGGNHE